MYIYINICSYTNIYGKKTYCKKKMPHHTFARKKLKPSF